MLCRPVVIPLCTLAIYTIILTILSVPLLNAEECDELKVNTNIVEVSVDKNKLSGSGVLLTFDGYIVTAAHVLVGNIKPPVPLRYFVRFQKDPSGSTGAWRGASLRKLDRDLDIAILKLDDIPSRPSLVASAPTASSVAEMESVCLSGFGLRKDASGAVLRLGFASIQSSLLPDETGYLIPEKKVASGYSGGGMFHDGRFAGMIVRRRVEGGSYVVPGDYIVDFVGSLGIFIDEGRFMPGVPPQALRREIQGNRKTIKENNDQLARIFRSMEWDIVLLPPVGDDFKIVLKSRRAFPDQILDGYFVGDLTVHFDDDDFRQRLQNKGEIHKAVISAEITAGEVLMINIKDEITEIKGRYYPEGLDLKYAPVLKFIIEGKINYQGWSRDIITKELNVDQY